MSLRYLDEAEAEKLCESTLTGWITSAGYKGCRSANETREAVNDAKRWAKDSRTALSLMAFVETSPREILVVGMLGGYQCFDSTGTDQLRKVPVVYIDLDGRLTRYVRTPHQLHLAPEECPQDGVKVEALDNRIALLHEFGHSKQWIENPLVFDGHFKQQKGREPTPEVPLRVKVDDGDPLLNPGGVFKTVKRSVQGGGNIGESFAQSIQRRAGEVWGERGQRMRDPLLNPDGEFLLTRDELDAMKPVTGYSVRIEADNIARHEWPICDELGIPRRLNYRDLTGRSTAQASLTSTLLKRQGESQGRAVALNERRSMGKVACPKCGKMVMKGALMLPCKPNHG